MSVEDHERPPLFKAALANLSRRATPSCHEVVRLTSEQRDHSLSLATKWRLALHRRYCMYCARYATQLDLVQKAMHQFADHLEETREPGISADHKARLKRALKAQALSDF